MAQKTIVRFVKRHGVYNSNDVAGFDKQDADKLIRNKVAVAHDPKSAAATVVEQNPVPTEPEKVNGSLFADLLDRPVKEISETLANKDENGVYVLSEPDLQRIASEENMGKGRKGVLKAIEDEMLRRVEESF